MTTKKGLQTPTRKALTKTEQKVFEMITKEFLNSTQIRKRLNCTRQNVSKHLRSIVKKGYLNSGNQPTNFCQPNMGSTWQPNSIPLLDSDEKTRLHGEEWHIGIIQKDHNYQNLLKKSNTFQLSGHTIRLHENVIEIYAGEGISFYGIDENAAEKKSLDYWYGFFSRLENYTKTILVKNGSANIKRVNAHFAHIDSEICENYLVEEGRKLKVFCPIDGKLAYTTDESWGEGEDECLHPVTGKQDRGKIDKHINDFRLNDPRTNSEIDGDLSEAKSILVESAKQIKETAKQVKGTEDKLDYYAENQVSHVGLMRRIADKIDKMDAREERLISAIESLAKK